MVRDTSFNLLNYNLQKYCIQTRSVRPVFAVHRNSRCLTAEALTAFSCQQPSMPRPALGTYIYVQTKEWLKSAQTQPLTETSAILMTLHTCQMVALPTEIPAVPLG